MAAPKPVVLTQVASLPAGSPAPQPLAVVGTIPAAAIAKAAHVDPTTGTTTQIINALIAAGLMS